MFLGKNEILIVTTSSTLIVDKSNNKIVSEFICQTSCCAIAPDHSTLALANKSSVFIWKLKTGDLEHPLIFENVQIIHGLLFSPNSQILAVMASTFFFGSVKIFLRNIVQKDNLPTIDTKRTIDFKMAFSFDSKILAVTTLGSVVNRWWVSNGESLRSLYLPFVSRIKIFSIESLVCYKEYFIGFATSVFSTNKLFQWHSLKGDFVTGFECEGKTIKSIAINDNRQLMAEANEDGEIRIRNILYGNYIKELKSNSYSILNLQFSKDGEELISCHIDNNIIIHKWTCSSNENKIITANEFELGLEVYLTSFGDKAVVIEQPNHWLLRSTIDGREIAKYKLPKKDRVYKVYLLREDSLIIIEYEDTLYVSTNFNDFYDIVIPITQYLLNIVWISKLDSLLLQNKDTVFMWNTKKNECAWKVKFSRTLISKIQPSPDENFFSCATKETDEKYIEVFSMVDGKKIWQSNINKIHSDSSTFVNITFSSDSDFLITYDNQAICEWSLKTGKTNYTHSFSPWSSSLKHCIYTKHGKIFITFSGILIAYKNTKKLIPNTFSGSYLCITFDKNYLRLAVYDSTAVNIFDLSRGISLCTISIETEEVRFSSDANTITTKSKGGEIKRWNIPNDSTSNIPTLDLSYGLLGSMLAYILK